MEDVWQGLCRLLRLARQGRAHLLLPRAHDRRGHGLQRDDARLRGPGPRGEALVPFRTWRNNITGKACAELTPLLDFAVPQRWSIAHLYQSILEGQPHVPQIERLTTLAGYVHWKLTGEHKMGVGEASGMFPIDPRTGDWDAARMAKFDSMIAPRKLGWKLRDILPQRPSRRSSRRTAHR